MTLPIINCPVSADEVFRFIKKEGYAIIKGLAPSNVIKAVAGQLEPFFGQTPNCEGYFWGLKTIRMGGIITKSPASHELITHPFILEIVQAVLGPYCSSFQLNLTQAIRIEPGEIKQPLHRDQEVFPYEHPGSECQINVMWALDDFTKENGATRIIPRSHLQKLDRDPPEDQIIPAEMPRGTALIYLGSLTHSGGGNKTTRPRTGLAISYSLGWLRQAENQFLAIPPEIASTLPEQLTSLIGYRIHEPNLGWYEGQDPKILLSGERPVTLPARDYIPRQITEKLKERQEKLLKLEKEAA